VKHGSTGVVVQVDVERTELTVAFYREGTIRLPADYVRAGYVEYAYARTTFGVQGSTQDVGRYQPSDVSRFEEGYVAITRARDRTHLYVADGDLESDDEAGHGALAPDETGLEVVAGALASRSDKRLAHETDPLAAAAAALARDRTLMDLRVRRADLDTILRQEPRCADHALASLQGKQAALVQRREA